MSIASPIKIVESGLVFYYDAVSPRSYVGQPTTNYVTYPLANWNGSGFALSYNYANNGVSYAFDTSILTPRLDYSGVMRYYTGNTDYKYWSIIMNGLSSGTYAFSYYAKASVAGGINNSQLWRDSGTDRSVSGDWNPSYTTEWKRYVTIGPISVGNYLDYFPIHSGALTGGVYVYFWGFQLEKLSYATPLAIGTRSNTQGLLDMIGTTTIDLTNAAYDGSGNITFNGTGYFYTSTPVLPLANGTPLTLIAWCKPTNLTSWQTVLGTHASWRQIGFLNSNFYFGGNAGGGNNFVAGGSVSNNNWYMLAMVYDGGTTGYGYINGVLSASGNIGTNGVQNGVQVIGSYHTGGYEKFQGSIQKCMVYNRALSAAEISQNYNATKHAFGL